jgi:acyl-[acyl-carrier-protein]-phospholipid O-acyltransferase/long-chain-fatty-acid--[acyl-carrier-protein] ligase
VKATGANVLISTDTFASHYARAAEPHEMSSLIYAVLGAERVREETRAAYARKFGTLVLEGYGATECSPVVAVNQPEANRPGTVGRLLPGVEARLVRVGGVTEGGQLFIRGPNVMKGYLRPGTPQEIDPPPDGWFDTGDLATLDADGFLTITGRLKRFARIGAEMVSLALVEAHAQALWPQGQHAAVSTPGERRSEQVVLVTDQPKATASAFRDWAKTNNVRPIEAPDRIVVVKEVPLLPTGKVDYPAAQRMAEERLEPAASHGAGENT